MGLGNLFKKIGKGILEAVAAGADVSEEEREQQILEFRMLHPEFGFLSDADVWIRMDEFHEHVIVIDPDHHVEPRPEPHPIHHEGKR